MILPSNLNFKEILNQVVIPAKYFILRTPLTNINIKMMFVQNTQRALYPRDSEERIDNMCHI